jgi:hypothetical protein
MYSHPDPADSQTEYIRTYLVTVLQTESEKFDYVKVSRDEGELREEGAGPPEGQDAEHPAAQHCRHTRILLFNHIVTLVYIC